MHRRIILASLLIVLALALSACVPATLTPGGVPTTSPVLTPGAVSTSSAVSTTQPAATSAIVSRTPAPAGGPGRLFAGTVKHAGQPVPGARVELREVGWATNRTAPVATAVAGADGAFSIASPPAGDFSVLGLFPDGEMDAGGWPPVSIAPGQEITGFVVPLERRLTLLSPIADAPVAPSPALTWKASPEATHYRVWVIDAGTTAMMLDQETTGTSIALSKSLKPGMYQWVVNGLNPKGDMVATASETFVVRAPSTSATGVPTAPATPAATSEADGLPPPCQPRTEQTAVYADRALGFCFLYPSGFEKNPYDAGQINVVGLVAGPALDSSADPLRATVLLEVIPSASPDLAAAVTEITREFQGQPGVTIKQQPIDLGGVPAVLLTGVPGRGGSRDVVAVQNGLRYRLLFMPEPQMFPKAAPDFQALYDAVTQSFTFFQPAVTESEGPNSGPGGMPRLPDDERAFDGAREALAQRLGVDPLSIRRVEQTPTEWQDGCLGLTSPGEACPQAITSGWVIVLDAAGQRYEAHTDQEGRAVRFVQ